MKFQVCLYGKSDVGGSWTPLASAQTRKGALAEFARFLAVQPLHHWGISSKSLVKLYSKEHGFLETLSI